MLPTGLYQQLAKRINADLFDSYNEGECNITVYDQFDVNADLGIEIQADVQIHAKYTGDNEEDGWFKEQGDVEALSIGNVDISELKLHIDTNTISCDMDINKNEFDNDTLLKAIKGLKIEEPTTSLFDLFATATMPVFAVTV